ncbi:hypothetical protein ABK040_007981 [Willaertia magna]
MHNTSKPNNHFWEEERGTASTSFSVGVNEPMTTTHQQHVHNPYRQPSTFTLESYQYNNNNSESFNNNYYYHHREQHYNNLHPIPTIKTTTSTTTHDNGGIMLPIVQHKQQQHSEKPMSNLYSSNNNMYNNNHVNAVNNNTPKPIKYSYVQSKQQQLVNANTNKQVEIRRVNSIIINQSYPLSKDPNVKIKKGPKKKEISREEMMKYFNVSQTAAARLLGVSVSTLKRRFYEEFNMKWPYTPVKAKRKNDELEGEEIIEEEEVSREEVNNNNSSSNVILAPLLKNRKLSICSTSLIQSSDDFDSSETRSSNPSTNSNLVVSELLNQQDTNEKQIDSESLQKLYEAFQMYSPKQQQKLSNQLLL